MWLLSTKHNKILKINNYFCLTFILLLFHPSFSENMSKIIHSVDFEIYGKVQGVFFRKYTLQEAQSLGLRGWCMNTEKGTVQGVIQGDESSIKAMKRWLKSVGSPQSRIDKAEFNNETEVNEYGFNEFKIRR